jgi:catechol 2,3-dioxygenase-like lactoylglutathione lyase family enzyme
MAQVQNFSMIILLQKDLEKAITFYQKLGLKLIFQLPNKWAEFTIGPIKLGLCPVRSDHVKTTRTGIVFTVDDLVKFYEDYNNEIMFVNEPVTKAHGIMVSIKDPSGNIIDLYQPTPEKLDQAMKTGEDLIEKCCQAENYCKKKSYQNS